MYANKYESNKDSVLTHIIIHINKKKHMKNTLSRDGRVGNFTAPKANLE